jgi:3-oxoadipate enol-lactonase
MLERLVLLSTFAQKTPYYDALEFSWQRALDVGGYPLMLDIMLPVVLGEGYFENPLIPLESLKRSRIEANNDPWALKKLMAAIHLRGDYREELKKIKAPTLVIHGERDVLFPVHMGREAADLIPGSRFEVIPGVGHTLNLEAIPQTVALMNNFLRTA